MFGFCLPVHQSSWQIPPHNDLAFCVIVVLSVCIYPIGNPALATLSHTWLYSNIDFVSFSCGLSYKLHLSFCLGCFRVIDYWMNWVHPKAEAWFNPLSARDFRSHKLKLRHSLQIRTVDVFPGCWRAVLLGTPLGLKYLLSPRHRVNPQFVSRQWTSVAVRGEWAVCLQPLNKWDL